MKRIQVVLGLLAVLSSASSAQQGIIVLENAHVRYSVSAEGRNLAFIDRASGVDYLRRDTQLSYALVRCSGVEYPAISVLLVNGSLTNEFSEVNVKAVLHVKSLDSILLFNGLNFYWLRAASLVSPICMRGPLKCIQILANCKDCWKVISH
jgi:hypothetical protein